MFIDRDVSAKEDIKVISIPYDHFHSSTEAGIIKSCEVDRLFDVIYSKWLKRNIYSSSFILICHFSLVS